MIFWKKSFKETQNCDTWLIGQRGGTRLCSHWQCRVLVIKLIGHLEHESHRDVRWVVATFASYNPLRYNGVALKTIMDESSMSCKSIHYIIIQYCVYIYICLVPKWSIFWKIWPPKNEGNPAQKRGQWVCLGISMPLSLCLPWHVQVLHRSGRRSGDATWQQLLHWEKCLHGRCAHLVHLEWFLSMSYFHDCLQDEMPAAILVVPHDRWWDTSQLAKSQWFLYVFVGRLFWRTILANRPKSQADFYCGCAENYKCNTDRCRSCRGAFGQGPPVGWVKYTGWNCTQLY